MSRPFTMLMSLLSLSKLLLPLLVVLPLVDPLPSARAAITPTGNVEPSNPSTWDSSTTAYIGNTSSGTLTVNGGSDLLSGFGWLGYGSTASGLVTISGTGSTWAASIALDVGYGGTGTLKITNGGSASVAGTTYVGDSPGAAGTITVSGNGSTWTNSAFHIGYSGSGTLNIDNGGYVDSSDGGIMALNSSSKSIVTVDGPGSTWTNRGALTVGRSGSASLKITNGGSASVAGTTYVGDSSGSGGTITVSGAGSTLTASDANGVRIGCSGSGTLNITNGGYVSNGYASTIAFNSGSTGIVTVDGAGSTWTNSGYFLDVGYSGSATLKITNGGSVSVAGTSYVGHSNGSNGTVTVSGNGSTWTNSGGLYVGWAGAGTVTQTGGANRVVGTLCLGNNSTGKGAYNLNGGVLAVQGLNKGAGTATFSFGGGTLRADAPFDCSLPMTLTGTGGNATVDTQAYPVSLSGFLSGPGGLTKTGSGRLTLTGTAYYNGTTTVAGGTLNLVEAYLTAPAAWYPVLNLGGADVQHARSKLVFDYHLYPTTDPTTQVVGLMAASYHDGAWDTGKFRHSTASAESTSLGWRNNPTATSVDILASDGATVVNTIPPYSLMIMATLAGDADLNGVVDFSDLNIITGNYGLMTDMGWADGDFNYDGAVDFSDLNFVTGNYGEMLPAERYILNIDAAGLAILHAHGVTAVPEPGTIALLVSGLLALFVHASRKRR
jgi:T5SS/PEP-CTERM-associated repeat protein/autotransporter-associated beta strand protein